jgi:DNA topoisomerase-3
LQQEANRKFSYSAAKTLIITQALYEKHKAVTYPRTDANVLPSDYVQTAEQVLDALATSYPASSTVIDNNWVQLQNANKRIFNDALISDHFAIVPTDKVPSGLSSDEKNIYEPFSTLLLNITTQNASLAQMTTNSSRQAMY